MTDEAVVIKVENVVKSYKVGNQMIPVIKDVSFEVKKGDFTVIIGPSGSGKSTLLHMLLGLEIPTSGTVYCLGVDLYKLGTEDERSSFRKKHVGMVYQQPNWIKSLSVVENVSFPLSLLGVEKGEAVKKAWHALLSMNMSNWVNYFPTELSGGQQQKVALVRALITEPEIIIADEPTGNLDFESGQALMKLLTELNNSGKTVLMVTHDLEYLKYAKNAVKIFDGKLVGVFSGKDKEELQSNVKSKRGNEETILLDTSAPVPLDAASTEVVKQVTETPNPKDPSTEIQPEKKIPEPAVVETAHDTSNEQVVPIDTTVNTPSQETDVVNTTDTEEAKSPIEEVVLTQDVEPTNHEQLEENSPTLQIQPSSPTTKTVSSSLVDQKVVSEVKLDRGPRTPKPRQFIRRKTK